MEIFDRIRSMVGIGKATIELTAPTSPVRPGGEIRASVVLRGGEYDVAVQDIRLHLDEERLVFSAQSRGDFRFWQERASLVIPLSGRTLAKDEEMTFPVAIALLSGATQFETPWGIIMAASVIVTVPLIVLVLIFQRKIVAGLTAGGVKG